MSETADLLNCFVKRVKGGNRLQQCLVNAPDVVKFLIEDHLWFGRLRNILWLCWAEKLLKNTGDVTADIKFRVNYIVFFCQMI